MQHRLLVAMQIQHQIGVAGQSEQGDVQRLQHVAGLAFVQGGTHRCANGFPIGAGVLPQYGDALGLQTRKRFRIERNGA